MNARIALIEFIGEFETEPGYVRVRTEGNRVEQYLPAGEHVGARLEREHFVFPSSRVAHIEVEQVFAAGRKPSGDTPQPPRLDALR